MNMIPKVCHVVSFKEPFISNIAVVDNNLSAQLNPMRVHPEEEKYDIESNNPENSIPDNNENVIVGKYNTCCCTRKQLFEYIIVACITAILMVAIQYIIYIIKK